MAALNEELERMEEFRGSKVPAVLLALVLCNGEREWCSETSCGSSGWKSRRRDSQFAAVVISGRRAG